MPGLVAVLDPVAVLEADLSGGVDQDRAERLVAVRESLSGQLDAAPEVPEIDVSQVVIAATARAAR